jgi:hypothetical protein
MEVKPLIYSSISSQLVAHEKDSSNALHKCLDYLEHSYLESDCCLDKR